MAAMTSPRALARERALAEEKERRRKRNIPTLVVETDSVISPRLDDEDPATHITSCALPGMAISPKAPNGDEKPNPFESPFSTSPPITTISRPTFRNFFDAEEDGQEYAGITQTKVSPVTSPQSPPPRPFFEQGEIQFPQFTPVKEPNCDSPHLDMRELSRFIIKPIPQRKSGKMFQCRIEREKGSKRQPRFFFYLDDPNYGQRLLLAARKRAKGTLNANYLISTDPDDMGRRSKSYVGKIRGVSSIMGKGIGRSEYVIYDSGENPEVSNVSMPNNSRIRQEYGAVLFQTQKNGPRKVLVIIPHEGVMWRPTSPEQGVVQRYKDGKVSGMNFLHNKAPVWSEEKRQFVLHFDNRAKVASTKNFQLVSEVDESDLLMQFGKVSQRVFNVDFKWPISPYQAFAISLTNFDK